MIPRDVMGMFRRRGGSRCIEIGRRIQTFLDDGLDPANAARVAQHLDACRRCGLAADDYRRLKATLASSAAEVPTESLDRLRRFASEIAHDGDRR